MPQQFSAEALLVRVAERDAGALGELYDHFAPGLLALAVRILDDREAADEVLDAVFRPLWGDARRLSRERASVAPVLFRTARAAPIGARRAAALGACWRNRRGWVTPSTSHVWDSTRRWNLVWLST